ncbi:hypothetical protein DOY81_005703, partial [Sarcophaga bullata]
RLFKLGISLIALGKCQEAAQILQEGSKVDGTGVRDRVAHENARISSYLQLAPCMWHSNGRGERHHRAALELQQIRWLLIYRTALHWREM